jgi:hypothetical protein
VSNRGPPNGDMTTLLLRRSGRKTDATSRGIGLGALHRSWGFPLWVRDKIDMLVCWAHRHVIEAEEVVVTVSMRPLHDIVGFVRAFIVWIMTRIDGTWILGRGVCCPWLTVFEASALFQTSWVLFWQNVRF